MSFDFRFYWTLFLRRLPVMAALFLLCAGIGVALAFKLPTTYSTSARLLVEDPQIAGMQNASGDELLQRFEQMLLTRANLIEIANKHNVFGAPVGMTPDQIVERMRSATDIQPRRGRNSIPIMSISFEADDPRVVAAVVNDYVTLVEEENARLRARATDSTLVFFEQEVDRLNEDLNQASERIVAFKSANTNALPDSLEYRMDRQNLLQDRQARAEQEIAELRKQREQLVTLFETTGRVQAPQQRQLSPAEQRLAQLEAERESLKAVYSDSHIKVRQIDIQIAQVRSQVAQEGGADPDADNPQESYFNLAVAQIDARVEAREKEVEALQRDLEELEASIDQTAANGIVLGDLERSYANAQSRYNAALARRDQARIDQKANSSQLGQRITVIESGSVPNSPSSPNRPVVAMGGVAAGLAAMAALFLLLELLNRTIRRPVELTNALGVTPLATIPYMETRAHFWLRRSLKLAALAVVVIAVPLALWAIDTYYKPLDLIYGRLLAQLGL